ncbi:retron Eco8 family effector endonuclease [Bacillus glycinifermentans]|uniref:retron Eco8 family effector endonuclease n=1 Tax=Bacillus glycinifermentans TaxID=1664069 RepID=UPI001FF36722|nr:retron Eco8 family effector endonuclease [Bacillus glycinifermentans]UOY87647.1 retron Eco8 family effector endonuclease [Bacillus glycinifermentans]
MPIKRIEINNCKSIKHLSISFNHINCFLGENGSGKTNIMKAIKYFYDNLTVKKINDSLYDKVNPYIQSFEITIYYDFSRLVKIAESHLERHDIFDYKLNSIFKKIKTIYKRNKNASEEIKITLNQDKNGIQKWNVSHDIRVFLKNIFPIYFLQTRHLNLINWDDLWDVIGELSKTGAMETNSFRSELEECFKNAFGEKYSTILNYIENEFQKNDIEIRTFNSNQQFANIYQLQLGGNKFKHKFEDLEYFSDGVNSYNYLKLILNLISKISDRKIKEPTIIIDEPEIGLHPRYIDQMVETFFEKSDQTNLLISTHSSRIIKNLMSNSSNVSLYHISMEDRYSKLKKMKSFTDNRALNLISEEEASYYFAKNIVFVEGITEIELFSNKYLHDLFPFLKKTEFYAFDGNKVRLKIVHPNEKNLGIPYLMIVDLDKILKYNKKTSKFAIKKVDKFINPLKDKEAQKKEAFYYGERLMKTFYTRKRIEGLISKSRFYFDKNWGYIQGRNDYFNLLKKLIRDYCLEYNIFPVSTTIEGALINQSNHPLVYEWFENYYSKAEDIDIIDGLYNFEVSNEYKTTILRLINDGKFDNLESVNEWLDREKFQDLNDKIGRVKNKKTNGWVTNFMNYFFENYIHRDKLTNEDKISIFKSYFPEIFMMITSIKSVIKK